MALDPNQVLQQLYADDAGVGMPHNEIGGGNHYELNPHLTPLDPAHARTGPGGETPILSPGGGGNAPIIGPGGVNPSPTPPSGPAPQMMTLDEMIDIINRRTELATKPRLDALDRSRETMMYEGQRRLGTVQQGYQGARDDLTGDINRSQQQTSQTMARRGIYDSGLAMKLGNQVARKGLELGMQLGEKQAQELADVAEFIYLQQKHSMDEIQSIMGEKAMMSSVFLDEMRQEQQARGDMLAQQEFENWLAQQAMELNEYWQQQNFDAGRADQAWNEWFNQEQFRVQQEQAEWERVFNMNKWEAEREMQELLYNHQITQAEFNNAMALDDFNLRKWLYQAQNKGGSSVTYSQPAAPKASEGGMWWNLF